MKDERNLKVYTLCVLIGTISLLAAPLTMAEDVVADAGGPYQSNECQSVLFDASGSLGASEYRWNIDGTWTDWSSSPYLDYLVQDDYNGMVTLEAQSDTMTSSDTAQVMIANSDPLLVSLVGVNGSMTDGALAEIRVSWFDGDPRGPLWSLDSFVVSFAWGDGSVFRLSYPDGMGSAVVSHTYSQAGLYDVRVDVRDDDGGLESGDVMVSIAAAPAPPSITILDIIQAVKDLNLPKGTENSLSAKLNNAQMLLAKGKISAAEGLLQAFIQEVMAQEAKKIPYSDAEHLKAMAQTVLALLG